MRLVAGNLMDAWREPQNGVARQAMSLAACQGGMAFTNSSVCLVHGMSRPLGALYHVPHGLSNAVLLPAVTRYSIPGAPRRYANAARAMGWAGEANSDESACAALLEGLERLNASLAVPRLRDCVQVSLPEFESTLSKMAADALQSGSPQNNPVVPAAGEIVALYREAW
jgi:alcohol dehydrogenase class IV